MPVPPVEPTAATPAPAPQTPTRSPATIIAIILGALLVISIIAGLTLYRQKANTMVVAPTSTPEALIPTPTPALSQIAGLPAFVQLEQALATLSAAIATYTPQDETLTPPTLVLPLGFSQ